MHTCTRTYIRGHTGLVIHKSGNNRTQHPLLRMSAHIKHTTAVVGWIALLKGGGPEYCVDKMSAAAILGHAAAVMSLSSAIVEESFPKHRCAPRNRKQCRAVRILRPWETGWGRAVALSACYFLSLISHHPSVIPVELFFKPATNSPLQSVSCSHYSWLLNAQIQPYPFYLASLTVFLSCFVLRNGTLALRFKILALWLGIFVCFAVWLNRYINIFLDVLSLSQESMSIIKPPASECRTLCFVNILFYTLCPSFGNVQSSNAWWCNQIATLYHHRFNMWNCCIVLMFVMWR